MYKILVIVLLIFNSSLADAQTIKLNYKPKGVFIHFHLDGSDFYTDTTALMSIYNEKKSAHKAYTSAVKAHIRKAVANTGSDTISFPGEFALFAETHVPNTSDRWHLRYAVIELIEKRKVIIRDNSGHDVPKLMKAVKGQTESTITYLYTSHICGEQILEQTYQIRTSAREVRLRRF